MNHNITVGQGLAPAVCLRGIYGRCKPNCAKTAGASQIAQKRQGQAPALQLYYGCLLVGVGFYAFDIVVEGAVDAFIAKFEIDGFECV